MIVPLTKTPFVLSSGLSVAKAAYRSTGPSIRRFDKLSAYSGQTNPLISYEALA
tara:strand:+ start:348 stop:509 length:162 start_codon:yes stop_codon:yes gene_type:complete